MYDIDRRHRFESTLLHRYTFKKSDDSLYGYDVDGRIYSGEVLREKAKENKIVRYVPRQYVCSEDADLGYIQECPDGSWLAHSAYHIDSPLDGIEVFGFCSEFYAVRYLHEVLKAVFPDSVENTLALPWKNLTAR